MDIALSDAKAQLTDLVRPAGRLGKLARRPLLLWLGCLSRHSFVVVGCDHRTRPAWPELVLAARLDLKIAALAKRVAAVLAKEQSAAISGHRKNWILPTLGG